MATHTQILVIGGGPAGIQAALAAARSGSQVILVSDGPLGGRAAWQTLLPSKMWLAAGDHRDEKGTGRFSSDLFERMRARYEKAAWNWQRQLSLDLERTGVELRLGTASFISPHEVQVVPPEGGYSDQISADSFIIATGAVPYTPPGLQADGERVFAPHLIWGMRQLPESLIVIGSGGPATEYVDAFSRLGVAITWITGPVGVLSAFPPDAGRVIAAIMERRRVKIITGLMARQMERTTEGVKVTTADGAVHAAGQAFIAVGMRPDFERLNLPAAGLKPGSSGGVAVDQYGRTAAPHIYVAGDAASPLSANISMAQGRLAGLHASGLPVDPLRAEQAVMAIYTNPQVAVVGRLTDRNETLHRLRVPFSTCLRAHLMEEQEEINELGFLEIAFDNQGRLTGALAVCPEAAEILTSLAVAIRAGLSVDLLASVFPAHPTFSELAILAARIADNWTWRHTEKE